MTNDDVKDLMSAVINRTVVNQVNKPVNPISVPLYFNARVQKVCAAPHHETIYFNSEKCPLCNAIHVINELKRVL